MSSRSLGRAPDPVAVLRAHRSAVNALAFHTSSGCLLSGDADGELKIWDIVRRRSLSSVRVHPPSSGVIGLGTSPHMENKILSQGRDGTVKCWQLSNGGLSRQPLFSVKSEAYHFCKLAVANMFSEQSVQENNQSEAVGSDTPFNHSIGGKTLIAMVGDDPSTVDIWDVDGGKRVEQLSQMETDDFDSRTSKSSGMCMALRAFRVDGMNSLTVVAGYEDGSTAVWDLRNPKVPQMKTKVHSEPVLSVEMDSTVNGGMSGDAEGKLVFFSLNYDESEHSVRKEVLLGNPKPGIADIAIRQDDKICAIASWNGWIRIYDYHRRRALAILKYHSAAVTSVLFTEDLKLLVSGSNDATIALWSIYPPH